MSRRRAVLLAVGAALLALAGVVAYLLRTAPAREPVPQSTTSAHESEAPAEPQVVAREPRQAVAPPPEPAPAVPPEDLRAEGARRGWQLPFGKGWWTDELVNPGGVEPDGARISELQARVVGLSDQLDALRQRRKQRLDAYCQERIAAGLAVEDDSHEFLSDGREYVWVTVRTPAQPSRTLRVDVGAGDDIELDQLDKRLADAWCEAVLELRRLFVK